MSLDRVKMETSVSQFALWMEFFEWEINAFNADRYYMAQIAAEVRRSYVKEPNKISIKEFLRTFIRKKNEEGKLRKASRLNRTKNFFFALTGMIGKAGKKKDKK